MVNDVSKIDVAIIGGGILGLWCAYFLLKKFPHETIVVFESEKFLGEHSSGRNSEVLHSGIYYPTNSLKHLHCLEGNKLWRDYVKQKEMAFLDCGKFITANSHQEAKLEDLLQRAEQNRVPGIRRLKSDEIRSLKNVLHLSSGFKSSTSAVLSVSESLRHLRNDIEAMGGVVLTLSQVKILQSSKENFVLGVNGDKISCSRLINCAGLYSVELRMQLGLMEYENYYVKGNYLKLRKKIDVGQLVYPIPPAHGLGLGVHLTLDTAGDQKFGPDTEEVMTIDYSMNDALRMSMFPAINETFKNIQLEDLSLAYSGIRPKVKKKGLLASDFCFQTERDHGIKGYYEFLGIESPGVTASPSLGLMLSKVL